jgi:hypothetical protein
MQAGRQTSGEAGRWEAGRQAGVHAEMPSHRVGDLTRRDTNIINQRLHLDAHAPELNA